MPAVADEQPMAELVTEVGLVPGPRTELLGNAATTPAPGPRAPATRPSPVGKRLAGRYLVVERIGAGGMGEVYLAEHEAIGKRVAIKVLGPEFNHRQDLVERFLQEARAASRIRHENIVDITDYGHADDGAPFFAMEYLEGEDLRATVQREGPLPWQRVRGIIVQILAALAAAHDQGVIHRDMKPDNCFRITRGDNPDYIKVLDFGIAKIVNDDADHQTLTRTGTVIGTAHYMSPEQARSEKLDARADLYSVGVIAFQLLTGRVPFEGTGFLGVLAKHITEPIPNMVDCGPDLAIPPQVEAIVRKAMAKNRDERYQTAEEFAAALTALPDQLSTRRRPRGLVWVAAGLGALALAAGGWLVLGPSGADTSADTAPPAQQPAAAAEPPATPEWDEATEAATEHYTRGQNAFASGEYVQALTHFSEAQRLYPSPDFHFNIGRTHESLEHYTEAIAAYQAYLDEYPAKYGEPPADAANVERKIARLQRIIDATAPAGDNAEPEATAEPTSEPAPNPRARRKPGASQRPAGTPESSPAPTPAPSGPAALPDKLSSEDMRGAVSTAKRAASECGAKHPGSLLTSVKVSFTVAPNGKVSSAKALPPVGGTPVGGCAEQAIRAQTFPASRDGASTTVSLPLTGG